MYYLNRISKGEKKVKKRLIMLLSIMLLLCVFAFLFTACDEDSSLIVGHSPKYTLSADGTYYIVTGCKKEMVNLIIDDTYNGKPVKGIRSYAFSLCEKLESVTIGKNVEYIESYAFSSSSSSIELTIKSEKISISSGAFNYSLENTKIKDDGFYYIKANGNPYAILVGAYNSSDECDYVINKATEYICSNSLDGFRIVELVIPDSVKSIGEMIFFKDSYLQTVHLGSNVKYLGKQAFYDCDNLSTVVLSNKITTIEEQTFYDCDRLTNITIPNDVTTIGERAFYDCDGLTEIVIPNSVTDIGKYAFFDCDELTNVTLSDNLINVSLDAFGNCDKLEYNTYDGVKYLGSATNKYLYLATSATTLSNIKIKDTCKFIGTFAFYNLNSLTLIIIPKSVTNIDKYAFFGCANLTIYCESEIKQSGFNKEWNYLNIPYHFYSENVKENCWHYVDNVPTKW